MTDEDGWRLSAEAWAGPLGAADLPVTLEAPLDDPQAAAESYSAMAYTADELLAVVEMPTPHRVAAIRDRFGDGTDAEAVARAVVLAVREGLTRNG